MKNLAISLLLFISLAPINITTCDEAWPPPIGIPAPSFGINETYRMYDVPETRNPALTYNTSESGGYFTHYVDSTAAGATDSSNAYGSVAKPRLTIPKGLPAGSVVEVHNSANANGSGNCNLTGKGTAAMPIFVRGVGFPALNMTALIGYTNDTEYLIVEGFKFSTITVHGRYGGLYNGNHISVRECECSRLGCYSYIDGSFLNNIVFYKNSVHDGGDWTDYQNDNDEGGISVQSRSSYVWVVENESYHNQFNGIQILAYPQNVAPDNEIVPHHIYVGRNEFYENQQPGFWTKTARDVIFSQNISHGHKIDTNYGTLGSGAGGQYDAQRVWYLFNLLYDNHHGIKMSGQMSSGRDEHHFIGNIIYNCNGYSNDGSGNLTPGKGDGIQINSFNMATGRPVAAFNTIYNARYGFANDYSNSEFSICNNIIANCTSAVYFRNTYTTYQNSDMDYNLLYGNGDIVWGSVYNSLTAFVTGTEHGDNCVNADPLFVNPANGDFNLKSESPFNNMETSSKTQAVFDRFLQLYGIDLALDIEGCERVYVSVPADEISSPDVSSVPDTDMQQEQPDIIPAEQPAVQEEQSYIPAEQPSVPEVSNEITSHSGEVSPSMSTQVEETSDPNAQNIDKKDTENLKYSKIKSRRIFSRYDNLYNPVSSGNSWIHKKESFE